VADLQLRFVRFFEVFDGIGKNLRLAQAKFEDATRKAARVNERMGSISGVRTELPEGEPIGEIEPAPRAAIPAEVARERGDLAP